MRTGHRFHLLADLAVNAMRRISRLAGVSGLERNTPLAKTTPASSNASHVVFPSRTLWLKFAWQGPQHPRDRASRLQPGVMHFFRSEAERRTEPVNCVGWFCFLLVCFDFAITMSLVFLCLLECRFHRCDNLVNPLFSRSVSAANLDRFQFAGLDHSPERRFGDVQHLHCVPCVLVWYRRVHAQTLTHCHSLSMLLDEKI